MYGYLFLLFTWGHKEELSVKGKYRIYHTNIKIIMDKIIILWNKYGKSMD